MTKNYYLKSEDIIPLILDYKDTGVPSNELGEVILTIGRNLSKSGKFIGYTKLWKEEMISTGVELCLKYCTNFCLIRNPKGNAFNYLTMIMYNGFLTAMKKDKKQRGIIDDIKEKLSDDITMKWIKNGTITYQDVCPDAEYYKKKRRKKKKK